MFSAMPCNEAEKRNSKPFLIEKKKAHKCTHITLVTISPNPTVTAHISYERDWCIDISSRKRLADYEYGALPTIPLCFILK